MMVLLGHGETGGPADQANPLKSIYLDDTPIQNPDGSFNFQNMQVSYRTGTQTQPAIPGFPAVETEIGVGLEVKASNPITQTVADVNATAIRVTVSLPAGLRSTDPKTGDTSGASVQYAIDLAPTNGKFAQAAIVTISDKTAANYQRSTRLPLTGAGRGWSASAGSRPTARRSILPTRPSSHPSPASSTRSCATRICRCSR
ncbi:Uncharacterised protein [Chromobacterium violaceum]|uniref:Tip attachment protein J HDII-ins2 domain-containing protein n=1 Tax=Chromobacterium violaceum TaxID=536 RepID=A0A3S4HRQ5_CHRVL|nr:Uncharacterised protein [Chromobacterium violaceum]